MKIILAGTYPSGTEEKFKELLKEHEIIPVTTQEKYEAMTEGDCIIVRVLKTPESVMRNKKDLKAVIRWGAGYDSVDIEAAGKLGIMVANMPGVNAYSVAELAVAMMLNVGRGIVYQNKLTHNGVWDRKQYSEQMTTLNHKIVGVIGGGNIGRRVAAEVQALGAEVVYYDAFRMSEQLEKQTHMKYMELDQLLQTSDVITIHVPLLENTRHMIGERELSLMKSHAIIVNTARGGLIDDDALYHALVSGRIMAACLDCVENENLSENPLTGLDNVIITPHIGGTSNDLADEMVPQIAGQIKKLAETGKVDHIVNQQYL